jgi:hypothetical protein
MTVSRTASVLVAFMFAAPAIAAPAAAPVLKNERVISIQGKSDDKAKAKSKDKAKNQNDRSNKSGETRGKDRSDQVQGMQDSGKGTGKRP